MLGLKGKDTSIPIMKVGGEEEDVKTKICSTYSIRAVEISCISDAVKAQLKRMTKLLGMEREKEVKVP